MVPSKVHITLSSVFARDCGRYTIDADGPMDRLGVRLKRTSACPPPPRLKRLFVRTWSPGARSDSAGPPLRLRLTSSAEAENATVASASVARIVSDFFIVYF